MAAKDQNNQIKNEDVSADDSWSVLASLSNPGGRPAFDATAHALRIMNTEAAGKALKAMNHLPKRPSSTTRVHLKIERRSMRKTPSSIFNRQLTD